MNFRLSNVELIGLQRAEFARAAKLQTYLFRVQIGIGTVAALSALVSDPVLTYLGTGIAFGLAILWAWLNKSYKESRSQAERARRASVIMEGLGEPISRNERRDLEARFTIEPAASIEYRDEKYYDATSEPGAARLADILIECSFWSSHLLRLSAASTWVRFSFFFLLGLASLFVAIPMMGNSEVQVAARILCSFLTLLMSAEIFGAAIAYTDAAQQVSNIQSRLETAFASGYPTADLFMIFADYNAAVESAPMFKASLYKKHEARLNSLWHSNRS